MQWESWTLKKFMWFNYIFHFKFQKKHDLHILQNSEMLADFGFFLFNITQFVVRFTYRSQHHNSVSIVQATVQTVSTGLCELSQIKVSGLRTGLFFSASLTKPQLWVTSVFQLRQL